MTASVGNEVGWARKAVAVSVEGTFNGFKDVHGWSGPASCEEMCRLRQKIGFGWPYQDSHSCDFLLALVFVSHWGSFYWFLLLFIILDLFSRLSMLAWTKQESWHAK